MRWKLADKISVLLEIGLLAISAPKQVSKSFFNHQIFFLQYPSQKDIFASMKSKSIRKSTVSKDSQISSSIEPDRPILKTSTKTIKPLAAQDKSTTGVSPSTLRQNYSKGVLRRSELKKDPLAQFDVWFEEACACRAITEPNAMALSTANCDLVVTSRIVLLKAYTQKGFSFFTNITSLKGKQIAENSHVSLLFYWPPLERQIQIFGTATLLPIATTERYFHSRPRDSQLAAYASFQSAVLPNRQTLEARMHSIRKKFKNQEIPLPDFWGGYLVAPNVMKFWQGRQNRLHDCFEYTKKEKNWIIERLNP